MQIISRALYALVIILIWMRLLQIMRINEQVGILSIILGQMVSKDIATFLALFLVISPSFGLALSVLKPRHLSGAALEDNFGSGTPQPFWAITFRYLDSPFWIPWWSMLHGPVGDFEDDLFEQPRGVLVMEWLIPTIFFIYLVIALVVLLNLLIAAMSESYTDIKDNGTLEWQFARAQVRPPQTHSNAQPSGTLGLCRDCAAVAW